MKKSIENTIQSIAERFEMLPHPEGGFFKEVYRSAGVISKEELGANFGGERNFCTSIYFLLTSDNFSGFHRIKQDEIWHFYSGAPLTVHVIDKEGIYTAHKVGYDLNEDIVPQLVVPAGCWFASSVSEKDNFAFVGCTVAPGFDFADFELANRADLTTLFPQHAKVIKELTRS